MKRSLFAVAFFALALTAGAQGATGVSLTAGGGAAFPTGDLKSGGSTGSTGASTGWNVLGGVGFSLPSIPFGLRAEVMYNHFGVKDADATLTTLTGGLNAVIQVPVAGMGFSPYVTGGVGYGRVEAKVDEGGVILDARAPLGSRASVARAQEQTTTSSVHEDKFMWNVGGGIKWSMAAVDVFVEARYMSLLTDTDFGFGHTSFVPLFAGITIRP